MSILDFFRLEYALHSENYLTPSRLKENEKEFRETLKPPWTLDRTEDILDLTSGSIIELEKIAGKPVDLLANGLLIARGEVVVVEDSFGVRITQVITADGRKEIANNSLHKSLI